MESSRASARPGRDSLGLLPVDALTERPRLAGAVSALLFVSITVLRFLVGTTGDAISFLYVLPLVLAAIAFGVPGGLIAAVSAFVLSSAWIVIEGIPVTPLGYFNRAIAFVLIGWLVGRFATRLRALEEESARHFDLSLDMISTAGFDGRFKQVNPAFERVLGYGAEDLVGRPFLDFVHPNDVEKTEEEAGALADGITTIQFQNRYFDKDGEVHWLEWTSVPLPNEEMIYGVARDVTERKAMEEELERLSQHDALTGLFNRRRFEEELRRQLAYTRRYGNGGALLMIDLDHFKEINDVHGHATGDEVLREVARLLRENLRATDTIARGAVVARLGGDEFVALLPEADDAGATAAGERLLAALRGSELVVGDRRLRLSISIGIAIFDEHGLPPERELLAAADRAMYVVKASGGDGVVVATAA